MHAESGLGFYSYDVEPESRTGIIIPDPSISDIHFKKSLDVSFDFKLRVVSDVFGYVNRIVVDDTVVDLLVVKPRQSTAHLVITSPGREMMQFGDYDLLEWNRIFYHIEANGTDSLSLNVNGTVLMLPAHHAKSHEVRIFFGRCTDPAVFTSDVSPMYIRDIDLKLSDRQLYHWELKDWRDLNKYNNLKIAVTNPDWTIEKSRHWEKVYEVGSTEKIFHAVDTASASVNFVLNGQVILYDISSGNKTEYAFKDRFVASRLANDMVVLPDGDLAYVDLATDATIVNRFHPEMHRWDMTVNRSSHSLYEHHNSFINPSDSSLVVLFGYGQHRYFNNLTSIKDGESITMAMDSIPPRYLSAVGVRDGFAYVLGGKGNPKGVQEYGIEIYDDIYKIDLSDYSVTSLGTFANPGREVPADNLIVGEGGKSVIALMYSPNLFKSALHLVEYDLESGVTTRLGDEIPYDFLDVDSDATLFELDGAYYAITVSKESSESYICSMYRIVLPIDTDIVSLEENKTRDHSWLWYVLAVVFVVLLSSYVVYVEIKRRFFGPKEFKIAVLSPGIHLLGSFKVIGADGTDCTASFTPTMRQLLTLLVLSSASGRDLSNSQMKDALWYDKSEESFFNNRGVNLTKIRNVMKQAGLNITFVSENGVWSVKMDEELCDYFHAVSMLRTMKHEPNETTLNNILAIASLGALLSDVRYDWLDKFKEDYDDLVIEVIQNIITKMALDSEQVIALADALLVFDSLDERAMREKCRALISLKRSGAAKSAFVNFTARYEASMGEPFPQTFSEFVK